MARQRLVRGGPPKPVLIGLLLVIVILGHDVLMATPRPALAAERPTLALTLDALRPHVSNALSHGCDVSRLAVLKAPDALPRQSTTAAIVDLLSVIRPAGLPLYAIATQARSPTAQRAVLQVFRI